MSSVGPTRYARNVTSIARRTGSWVENSVFELLAPRVGGRSSAINQEFGRRSPNISRLKYLVVYNPE
ncbi:MAG TPA: hypothetical protein VFV34_27250, partial [Blastocatellia bacterium]|nr:hypothetical protein [Blastocatellia bacterium]